MLGIFKVSQLLSALLVVAGTVLLTVFLVLKKKKEKRKQQSIEAVEIVEGAENAVPMQSPEDEEPIVENEQEENEDEQEKE